MRILLINPPYTRFKGLVQRYFPVGLGYIAATLKRAGHDVSVYNAENPALNEGVESWGLANRLVAFEHYHARIRNADDPIWQEVRRVIETMKPDAVGVGCSAMLASLRLPVLRPSRRWYVRSKTVVISKKVVESRLLKSLSRCSKRRPFVSSATTARASVVTGRRCM